MADTPSDIDILNELNRDCAPDRQGDTQSMTTTKTRITMSARLATLAALLAGSVAGLGAQ